MEAADPGATSLFWPAGLLTIDEEVELAGLGRCLFFRGSIMNIVRRKRIRPSGDCSWQPGKMATLMMYENGECWEFPIALEFDLCRQRCNHMKEQAHYQWVDHSGPRCLEVEGSAVNLLARCINPLMMVRWGYESRWGGPVDLAVRQSPHQEHTARDGQTFQLLSLCSLSTVPPCLGEKKIIEGPGIAASRMPLS